MEKVGIPRCKFEDWLAENPWNAEQLRKLGVLAPRSC
jgi:hypothetical protein